MMKDDKDNENGENIFDWFEVEEVVFYWRGVLALFLSNKMYAHWFHSFAYLFELK